MRAGFPHSEIFGSKLACQLPEAYRRLQRPSSPVVAKASTTCTYSLDPITVSTAFGTKIRTAERHAATGFSLRLVKPQPKRAATSIISNAISYPDEPDRLRQPGSPCFFRIFKEQPNKTECTAKALSFALHSVDLQSGKKSGGANRDRTGDLLLAKQALSQLSYGPNSLPGRASVGGSGWIRTIDPRLIKTML